MSQWGQIIKNLNLKNHKVWVKKLKLNTAVILFCLIQKLDLKTNASSLNAVMYTLVNFAQRKKCISSCAKIKSAFQCPSPIPSSNVVES